jgi:hypothetical protein
MPIPLREFDRLPPSAPTIQYPAGLAAHGDLLSQPRFGCADPGRTPRGYPCGAQRRPGNTPSERVLGNGIRFVGFFTRAPTFPIGLCRHHRPRGRFHCAEECHLLCGGYSCQVAHARGRTETRGPTLPSGKTSAIAFAGKQLFGPDQCASSSPV